MVVLVLVLSEGMVAGIGVAGGDRWCRDVKAGRILYYTVGRLLSSRWRWGG